MAAPIIINRRPWRRDTAGNSKPVGEKTLIEQKTPSNNLPLFKKMLVRGFEVFDTSEDHKPKDDRNISVIWIGQHHDQHNPSSHDVHGNVVSHWAVTDSLENTALFYGKTKNCPNARSIKFDDIISVDRAFVAQRVEIKWSTGLHSETISFDVDTAVSRDIICAMLASSVGVHQQKHNASTSPIWGGGLKTHFDPNPTQASANGKMMIEAI